MIITLRTIISHGIKVPAIVLLHGIVTVTLSLLERSIMTIYFFDYPTVIVTIRMGVVLFLIEVARIFGFVKMQPYNFTLAKKLFIPSLLTAIVAYVSINAVEQTWGIAPTMLTPIKQFTPICTIFLLNSKFQRPYPTCYILQLISALCFFAAIATVNEFSWDILGYFLALLTTIALALSNIIFENVGQKYSPVEMLYVHSFNCLLFLLLVDIYEDEIRNSVLYFFANSSSEFIKYAAYALVLGVLSQFVLFYSLAYIGAVTTTLTLCVANVIEILIATIFSVLIYFDRTPSMLNAIGGAMALIMGIALLHANPQLAIMTATAERLGPTLSS